MHFHIQRIGNHSWERRNRGNGLPLPDWRGDRSSGVVATPTARTAIKRMVPNECAQDPVLILLPQMQVIPQLRESQP